MPDPVPPTTKPPTTANGSELPPRLLAKLKVEIDGYELIERLGEGGQATVYRAIQKKNGQMVAVKVLHAGPHATEEARARLKREINALRAINHPNIVHAIAAGRTRSGLDCLVMNYVDGKPLDALWTDVAFVAAAAPQPADLLRLFKTICETVQAAHRKGITHRDLSPSNILIDASGQPHILDFGMASTAFDGIVTRNVTVTGQFIGKLKYASPEQARGAGTAGEGVDIRSDVYALGVMLYQLLTGGAFPYEVVGNVIDVLNNIIHSKPRPPSETVAELHTPTATLVVSKSVLPSHSAAPIRRNPPLVNETIEAIVLKALEKDPAKRYQSAGELAADIDRYLAGQPTSATVWSKRPKPASTFSIRRRPILAAASLILVATLAGVTMNARTLAVWLGLATVAAPVLPTDLNLAAPADAAAAAAQPGGPANEKSLNTLAEDLALVESKLRAVSAQLEAVNGRPADAVSGPMDLEAFCAKIAAASDAARNPIKFDLMSAEARAQRDRAEAEAIKGETDKDTLLAKRRDLDAQQAALWAQLTWGSVTSRNIDTKSLYKYRLKSPAMVGGGAGGDKADLTANDKRRFLDDGVKAFRTIDAVLRDASATLKSASGGPDGGSADTGMVLSDSSTRMLDALVGFQRTANTAADAGGMIEDDRKAIEVLRLAAESVVSSMNEAVEAQTRLAKSDDDAARTLQRRRLQQNLLDAAEAAARLDDRLVAVSKDWKAEFTNEKLGPVVAVVPKRTPERVHPNPKEPKSQGIAAVFPPESKWTGEYFASDPGPSAGLTASIVSVEGNVATMEWTNQNGRWQSHLEFDGSRVKLIDCVGIDSNTNTPNILVFEDISISGTAPSGGSARSVRLAGTWSVRHKRGDMSVKQYRSRWELRRVDSEKPAKAFREGETWSGTWTDDRGPYPTTATIKSVVGSKITLHIVPNFNLDGYDLTFDIRGEAVTATQFASCTTKAPSGFKILSSQGTYRDPGLDVSVRAYRTGADKKNGESTWTFHLKRAE